MVKRIKQKYAFENLLVNEAKFQQNIILFLGFKLTTTIGSQKKETKLDPLILDA